MGNTVKSHTELDCFTQRVVSVFDVWLDELERACAARVSAEKRTRFLNSRCLLSAKTLTEVHPILG